MSTGESKRGSLAFVLRILEMLTTRLMPRQRAGQSPSDPHRSSMSDQIDYSKVPAYSSISPWTIQPRTKADAGGFCEDVIHVRRHSGFEGSGSPNTPESEFTPE